ncbi:MAG: preprotein translocase subunit SecA [Patescibacteria group bacterium]|nr:preprotein translocase subunit SecA [Patescibacteria group bacterium]
MSFWDRLRGDAHTKGLKRFEPMVPEINAFEPALRALSDPELKGKTAEFRAKLAGKEGEEEKAVLSAIVPEAFAVVREAARRTLGQRHFDVQLLGGMVLNSGAIAEMRTGEGKTLVATLPAYVNALSGRGVHVVTVNDYLSRRDAVWMGQIYDALGLSVAVINHEASFIYDPSHRAAEPGAGLPAGAASPSDPLDKERDATGGFKVVHEFLRPVSRREAYRADITYGTNVEFGFDYLRDNLEYSADKLRQRPFNYAVVDEIDSILIDEARTPLIISAPARDAEGTYRQFASLVAGFSEDKAEEGGPAGDYTVDEKHKSISLTPAGIAKAEKSLGIDNIYTDAGIKFVHHLETAVKAKALYRKDKEYVVKGNEVVIVDEFTGRLQPGRRWSEGLHQAVEAKEGVAIQQESRTYATITYQNFFRMYPTLSGMTGTAATSSEEFYKVYGLDVYVVPTNKPVVRLDKNDQIFRTEAGKFKAIARRVKAAHDKGQPVLIGTVSIEKNELLSQFLKSEGVPHTMLNAKPEYAEREGETVAQAGKKGAVTIATNMAGRGVDIKLGGNPNTPESYEEVKGLGGLFVLGTERHEARRIDNQLRGRSGRQGDPGETQFFVSLEDPLMRVFASDMLKNMMGRLGMPEDEAIEHRMISRALESAQEKIEGFNFDARKHVLEFDDVINQQRSSVYARRRTLLTGSLDEVEAELLSVVGAAGAAGTEGTAASSRPAERAPLRSAQTARTLDAAAPSVPSPAAIVEKKYAEFGRDAFLAAARIVLLQTIDMYWVEHLEVMDYTRGSVNLRAYGQRDPLVEYKKEGLRLFKEMQAAVSGQVARLLPNIVPVQNGVPAKTDIQKEAEAITAGGGTGAASAAAGPGPAASAEPGRNDLCPCGSGKKYKNCGLKDTDEHRQRMAGK